MEESDIVTGEGSTRHSGPNAGVVAIVFSVLFLASLVPVTLLVSKMHFPSPLQSPEEIVAYFQAEAVKVRLCAFLQFCAGISLGIFTATMVSRMRYHGVNAAAVTYALFGGLTASICVGLSALVQWTIAQPGVAGDAAITHALYFLIFAIGGPGYSVPLGLFIAGISISAGLKKLLPRWLVIFGVILGIVGALSALDLISHRALPFIPLTRFPGFVWMIAAGFKLPVRARVV